MTAVDAPRKKRRGRRAKRTSAGAVTRGSVSVLEGSGMKGSKPRPFSYEAALRKFNGWIYAASMLNANAVAATRLRPYIRKRRGTRALWRTRSIPFYRREYLVGDAKHQPSLGVMSKIADFGSDFEEVVEPLPIIDVLRSANPYLNGFGLTVLRVLYGELTGNAYIHPVLDPDTGLPAELWPMPSQWVYIVPSETTFIKEFLYGQIQTQMETFKPEEVIHFKRPNPSNLYYGMGKVEAAWKPINLDDANQEMDLALADNYARPDYAVIVKSGASEPAMDRFEEKINQMLRGTRNAGKFVTISGDARITPLMWPPKDLAGRDDLVERIAADFNVPVSLLKANDPNLASAKTGFAVWHETSTLPLCRMDEEQLNQDLVPLYGEDVAGDMVLAYDDPVPESEEARISKNVQYVNAGIFRRNEVRVEEGREAVPEGDVLTVGGMALSEIEAQAIPPESTPVAPGLGEGIPRPSSGEPGPSRPGTGDSSEFIKPQDIILNGAQIREVRELVGQVVAGLVPRDSAVSILITLYGLNPDVAESIIGSAGTGEEMPVLPGTE